MFRFLFRATFWGFLALIALPSIVPSQTADTGPATHDTTAAEASLHAVRLAGGLRDDLGALCERQPGVCESSMALTGAAVTRAREGFAIASNWVSASTVTTDQETP